MAFVGIRVFLLHADGIPLGHDIWDPVGSYRLPVRTSLPSDCFRHI